MTAACHRFPPDAYGPLLESETERFITAVSESEWDGPVPACPGWTVAGLIEHVGGLHRWAEAHVRLLSQRRVRAGELDLQTPENLAAAASWLRAGVSQLVQTLRAADPDATVWTWGSDQRARFWGRRMLFETTVHCADIELARGRVPQIDPAVAVDGVDEFLDNLPHAHYFAPKVQELRGTGERIYLHARDAETEWMIQLTPGGFTWDHSSGGGANSAIEAEAAELLLFLYGRRRADEHQLDVSGDPRLIQWWSDNSAI